MNTGKCQFQFLMHGKQRERCNLPISKGNYCSLHNDEPTGKESLSLIQSEIRKPDHWLEGIYLQGDFRGLVLTGAQIPRSVFEGSSIESTILNSANLEGAIFRSTLLSGVSFCHANLRYAIFDRAEFKIQEGYSVDFRDADLGGASFSGVRLHNARLYGINLSKPTRVSYLLKCPSFEEIMADWEGAASIYTTLGKRAREDWDILAEDIAIYGAMTCRHRRVIKADPVSHKSYILDWIWPTIKSGPIGMWWYLQRIIWGYGYKPLRLVVVMLTILFLFSGILFWAGGGSPLDSILLSTQSFFTVTYGKCLPANKLCEAIGSFEAFLGTILVSLFVVSLATRFLRRI